MKNSGKLLENIMDSAYSKLYVFQPSKEQVNIYLAQAKNMGFPVDKFANDGINAEYHKDVAESHPLGKPKAHSIPGHNPYIV